MVVKLAATTFAARDVDALAKFYADALELVETVNDSPRYRELDGDGVRIGFAFDGVFDLLGLADQAAVTGLRSFLTFDVPEDGMEQYVSKAVEAGAEVIKPPFRAHFGSLLAVLRDPEGNVFRFAGAAA